MARPNILLITTDTQRWDTLACMGNPHALSLHLDRLAAEGVHFEQAHTSCPVCMPARSTLLTGVHAPIHGATENGIDRREHLTVFPDLLKGAGYRTILVGKPHFGQVPASFDATCLISGEKGSPAEDAYTQYLKRLGFDRPWTAPDPVPDTHHMEAFLVDRTIEALDEARTKNSAPFFAFCSLLSPHGPIDPPGEWGRLYDGRSLPPVNYRPGEVETHPAHMHQVLGLAQRTDRVRYFGDDDTLNMDAVDDLRRRYYGLASFCDAQIGRLIGYLDERGLRENTLVIFTSDHGTQLFDHGFDDKHNYYDASWRVPLMLSMPGTLPSGEKRDFASWTDLAPTILGAAGVSCPTMQGFDLFSPLVRREPSPRRCAVATLYQSCALVTRRWKIEYYFEEMTGRLFDRHLDPEEQHDLFDSPSHAEVRQRLLVALLAWRADLTDVQWLVEHTSGGGPVARIVADHSRALRGTDAEERLNIAIDPLDAWPVEGLTA